LDEPKYDIFGERSIPSLSRYIPENGWVLKLPNIGLSWIRFNEIIPYNHIISYNHQPSTESMIAIVMNDILVMNYPISFIPQRGIPKASIP